VVAHPTDNDHTRRDEVQADLREAYERGRKDARAARRRHPVLMTLTVLAAVVGVVLLALAAVNGSFRGAGEVVDENLAMAADRAEPAVRDAAGDARRTIGDAASGVTSDDRTETADISN